MATDATDAESPITSLSCLVPYGAIKARLCPQAPSAPSAVPALTNTVNQRQEVEGTADRV